MFLVKQKKIGKERLSSFFLFVCVLIYLGLRIYQGIPLAWAYFQHTWEILISRLSISFEDRVRLEGPRYLYSQKIIDTTSEDSTICFYRNDPILGYTIAAYFIYPRKAKPINQTGIPMIGEIKKNACTYILFNNGFPDIDLKAKSVILFGNGAKDQPATLETNFYFHNSFDYQGKIGLIKL
jgi:hypothetical protein